MVQSCLLRLALALSATQEDQRPQANQSTAVSDDHEFDQGSGIELEVPSVGQVEGLVLLAKVWGFLKYHHPRITAGELHWDYELFRVLQRVIDGGDREFAAAVLIDWIETLPAPEDRAPREESPIDPHLKPEISWIHDKALLGEDLCAQLEAIHGNRHASGKQYFVDQHPTIGQPLFTNEPNYAHMRIPDVGFRLLALFRYWNMIQYWFPYRDLIGEDWEGVLTEFVPRFVAADTPESYRLALMVLIARVHDTHANLWNALEVQPPEGKLQLPVLVRFIEGRAVVVGYSHADGAACGLKIGDVLLAIDGVLVDSLIEQWRPYYAASNEATRLRDVARNLTRGDAASCRVLLEREGRSLERSLQRMSISKLNAQAGSTHDLPGDTFRLLSPDVAYLKLSSVKSDQTAEYVRAASSTRGIIIDIRNYPSQFVVFSLGGHFVSQPAEFARFTAADLSNPGAFNFTDPITVEPLEPFYPGKIVILVDEVSQSQAEYTTMVLRAATGALVVGSTTAAADGNVTAIPLPGGLSTMISGIGVFHPDKSPTQRVGILADVEVRPTIRGVKAGRDEVLEEALRQILGDSISQEEIIAMAKHPADE